VTLILVAGWTALAVMWGWRTRPLPSSRWVDLATRRETSTTRPAPPTALARLGRRVSAAVPSLGVLTPEVVGLLTVAVPIVAVGSLRTAAWLVGTAMLVAHRRRRAQARSADRRLRAAIPVVVDLVGLGVGAGLSPATAIQRVGTTLDGPGGAWCREVASGGTRGLPLPAALAGCTPPGHPASGLVRLLSSAQQTGHALGPSLARVAADERASLHRAALARTRRLPVLLLIPLVCCTLPAFLLVAVVPSVAVHLDGVL